MPALSSTMKEGKIVAWNKKIGDKINSGDVLLVVESDKADMDVESFEEGYLAAIYTPEGGSALVGAPVAVLVANKEDIAKVGAASGTSSQLSNDPSTSAPASSTTAAVAVTTAPSGGAPQFDSITMPALSSTMKEGKIVAWNKKVGDKISSGDMVLVVESDKADMDVESFEEGYLASIAVKDGEIAAVGAPVGYLAKTAADIPKVQAYLSGGGVPAAATAAIADAPAASIVSAPATPAVAAVVNSGRISASGYAQVMAKQEGIDLRAVTPSRPDQYIVAKDLVGVPGSPVEHVPAAGSINASPTARKLASENNLDVTKIKGTGNFGRVMPEDVLRAAGKYVPPSVVATPTAAAVVPTAIVSPPAAAKVASDKTTGAATASTVLDGVVAMDGMQKAVAKNMEKTMGVPVFRVSR
jgi:pyruvate dehydrogenase E2 component (dihydrolipoamide acetyltransferase)